MRLAKFLLILAPLLLLAGAFYVGNLAMQDNPTGHGKLVAGAGSNVPGPPLPEPPPMEFKDVSREDAVSINAKIPFSKRVNTPARPFMFSGNEVDRQRAIACLTAAAYYEAGNDLVGASAVVQVVLNRVRHPVFPKTVCGVVFQGHERYTGCQFTFTCDGALTRIPNPAIWNRLRGIATIALRGYVFSPVGVSTHYHTNWVVPYWSGKLEKTAQVGTHLFFRWPGWYGEPKVFTGTSVPGEIVPDARIARLVEAEEAPIDPVDLASIQAENVVTSGPATIPEVTMADMQASRLKFADTNSNVFMVHLEPQMFPGSYATMALALCKDRPICEVWGWTDSRIVPNDQSISPVARQRASFHFERTRTSPSGIAQWNCAEFPRNRADQCLSGTVAPPAKTAPESTASAVAQ